MNVVERNMRRIGIWKIGNPIRWDFNEFKLQYWYQVRNIIDFFFMFYFQHFVINSQNVDAGHVQLSTEP